MKIAFAALLACAATALAPAANAQTPLLTTVKNRGHLVCGVSPGLAGFGLPDAQGQWAGLDVDLCRGIAAAVFDDPMKVKFTPLSSKDRFTALQSGEVDLLSRTSTWTMARDTSLGLSFAGVNYYDGQAFLVKKTLGVDSALKLNGASICLQQGTTTELNVADYFRKNGIKYEPVTFDKGDEAITAFQSGRCDALTDDSSALYALRLKLVKPDEAIVLPEIISKEPLGPVVRSSDMPWFNLVKWVHFAMLNAEELGVTQANVEQQKSSTNPEIRRLLGVEGKFGEAIGLTPDWAYRIVKHVGNYGEAFERNVGAGSVLKIARGKNDLWTKGGLQYAPPIR
ncbi:MAG: amino acid ABC transporter substrate-binding protein [Bosea sp. (in: a-proteobacteria)]|jgi:general L-amino acid transport system substrate-binding protein|uniref:amino acid ABC transporter substrate-binding protein n=1 Tax=unclassified Bosea (in: a-proteobacteria) TaxID=2653178 RepID=UPI00083D28D7|nr:MULTISPECIES: amino acid ABC transporter substrate-binding protein [unclassified Bosea (in: a-proteobacteria)]MBA4269615.1 amino acid ABC transporter substrate-binding protein [Methylobacterium sp.]MBX9873465.1 amino acid ABC transporter substrate-binding protein [Beijerinckiaceae bacterium]AOG06958.1 bacterial extracellular solute-binding s, 3 family protein [Bosea sp. RAC05]MBA4334492.1 amino acid ABC transporter substrate-binding protein [Methylobacterium sp.]MDP3600482.1 amino acid ABC 